MPSELFKRAKTLCLATWLLICNTHLPNSVMYHTIPMLDRDLFAAVNMQLISRYGSTTTQTIFLPTGRDSIKKMSFKMCSQN